MKIIDYSYEFLSPKFIRIIYENSFFKGYFYKVDLYYNGTYIGSYNKKQLKTQQEVTAPDGTKLYVQLKLRKLIAGGGIDIIKDNILLLGFFSHPQRKIETAGKYLVILGFLSLLFSLRTLNNTGSQAMLIFVIQAILALFNIIMGLSVKKQIYYGLWISIIIYILDTFTYLYIVDIGIVFILILFRLLILYPVINGAIQSLTYNPNPAKNKKNSSL